MSYADGSRLGYSRKGYMTGELGVNWMKNFEKATHSKANG